MIKIIVFDLGGVLIDLDIKSCIDACRYDIGCEEAARLLQGQHDFSAFCGNAKMKKSTVRFLRTVEITRQGEELRLRFTGNGFLYNMVRILVGTLVEVGRGQRSPESIPALFGGKREQAGFLAPPQGLCLEEVEY